METIEKGDVVHLNSGGPQMIVLSSNTLRVKVAWSDQDGNRQEMYFPRACLSKSNRHDNISSNS